MIFMLPLASWRFRIYMNFNLKTDQKRVPFTLGLTMVLDFPCYKALQRRQLPQLLCHVAFKGREGASPSPSALPNSDTAADTPSWVARSVQPVGWFQCAGQSLFWTSLPMAHDPTLLLCPEYGARGCLVGLGFVLAHLPTIVTLKGDLQSPWWAALR